jgi:hypothetical protein
MYSLLNLKKTTIIRNVARFEMLQKLFHSNLLHSGLSYSRIYGQFEILVLLKLTEFLKNISKFPCL